MPLGKRLIYRPEKAHCPHCQNTLLTPEHCFTQCPLILQVWQIIDQMGVAHFTRYNKFSEASFLDICAGYTPLRMYHLSALWAIWRQWCQFMYGEDYDQTENWTRQILKYFKKELIKRIHESMVVTQWIKVAIKNRRPDGERTVPEKEFLLIWANTVNTNPISIGTNENNIDPIMRTWIGKEEIIILDRLYHKPRLRFRHDQFASYVPPPPDGAPPSPPHASGWDPHCPAFMVG